MHGHDSNNYLNQGYKDEEKDAMDHKLIHSLFFLSKGC